MFDFWRATVFCLEYRVSKHEMTIYAKNVGGMTPRLRLWLDPAANENNRWHCRPVATRAVPPNFVAPRNVFNTPQKSFPSKMYFAP